MIRFLALLLCLLAGAAHAQNVTCTERPLADNSNACASTSYADRAASGAVTGAVTGLSGDVAATGPGSVAATIQPGAVTSAKMASMAAGTIKANCTSATGAPQDCASLIPVLPDSFCTVDRTGATDMGACINSAITAAKACNNSAATPGNSTVYLRAGTYLITTAIVPKSCVTIRGDGPGKTVLLTNSNAPFGPPAGQQLVHFNLDGVTFKDSGTHASAVVMTFPSIQDARFTNLGFVGYTTGTLMSIATSAVSSFDDTNTVWNNSNAIFNYFVNWEADSCGTCISEAGHYGTTPTASPANSSNVPDQIVTQNRYDNIALYNVGGKCLDFVKATDTEFATNIYCAPNSNSTIPIQFGDDNANFPGNNYVNSIRAQITISLKSPATTSTFFRAGDWTFGNVVDLETDLSPASTTLAAVQASVTQFKLDICGKNTNGSFLDAAGFNTNRMCLSNNFSGSGDSQSTYFRVGNGSGALPVWAFANDTLNGIYLPVAGTFGFTKGISSGVNGGTGGSVTLNGATSGSRAIAVSATANAFTFAGAALDVGSGGTGDTGSAWTTFSPNATCGTATFTTNTGKFKTLGKTTWISTDIKINALGTCAALMTFTLPNTGNSAALISGQDISGTSRAPSGCQVAAASTTATCTKAGGGAFIAAEEFVNSGVYENQ